MFYLGQYGRYSILDATYKSCLLFGAIWKVFNTGRNIQILCFTWGNMEGIQYWMQHTNLVFYLGQYGRYSILGVTYKSCLLFGAIWKVFNTGCNIQILSFIWGNMEGIQYWMQHTNLVFYLGQYGRYSILDATYRSCVLLGAIWKVFNTGCNIQILCFTWGNMEGIQYWA